MDIAPPDPHRARPPELRLSRDELHAAIAERNARQHAEDRRARLRFWGGIAAWCWAWALGGLALAGLAFRVTDAEIGAILLLAGQAVTVAGVLGTLGYALVESERRGWR